MYVVCNILDCYFLLHHNNLQFLGNDEAQTYVSGELLTV